MGGTHGCLLVVFQTKTLFFMVLYPGRDEKIGKKYPHDLESEVERESLWRKKERA